ncbi:MAG: alpha-ketoacid dehydrogenase subunit beta [Nitrospiraceae bacterium]|nr:alpha-ketoacid dehydrogenase subunit beta [Nitrospiraceae bacterium]
MAAVNMVQALNMALRQEMEKNTSVTVMGEDVGRAGGVFRVTEGLFERFGGERVIDTPLSEAGIAGAAIGMAVCGLLPVAEIQFMGFIYGAFDQIINHAARLRNRSRGRFSCPIVIRTPYGAGIKALEIHSESTEALFAHIPGIKVVVPSGPYNAKGLLVSAIRDPDPVIFLEPTRLYRMIKEEVPEEPYSIPLGRGRKVKEGKALTLISWGSMLQRALKAAEGFSFDTDVIDLMSLSPWDEEMVLSSVKKTGRAVIVQEAPKTCGFASEVAATIAEEAIAYLRGPVLRVTAYDVVLPFSKLEEYYMPSIERIKNKIEEAMRY